MGNDLKYGLILGVVVLLIFVGWMVIHNRGAEVDTETTTVAGDTVGTTPEATTGTTSMWDTSGVTGTGTAGTPVGTTPAPGADVAYAPTTNVTESPIANIEISRPVTDVASVREQTRTTYQPGVSAPGGASTGIPARSVYSGTTSTAGGGYTRPTGNPPVDTSSFTSLDQTAPVITDTVVTESEKTHTVASGETLQDISRKYFGTTTKWREIAEANPDVNPNRMRVGQKIKIPGGSSAIGSSESADSGLSASSDTASGSGKSYTVVSGDTLYRIAEKEYGKGGDWKKIYDANRDKLSSPQALKVGTTLVIP